MRKRKLKELLLEMKTRLTRMEDVVLAAETTTDTCTHQQQPAQQQPAQQQQQPRRQKEEFHLHEELRITVNHIYPPAQRIYLLPVMASQQLPATTQTPTPRVAPQETETTISEDNSTTTSMSPNGAETILTNQHREVESETVGAM